MIGLDVELVIRVGGKWVVVVYWFSFIEFCWRGMVLFGMLKVIVEKGGG